MLDKAVYVQNIIYLYPVAAWVRVLLNLSTNLRKKLRTLTDKTKQKSSR